ncbi:MAG: hypothetical protein DSM107014_02140 [Gomphosphaeria aponina SAG 52.96 = DSM 107014]|uniref:Uncharacterized protein n=1 Tax=Gomphosphaeria aponina SAG 52.96 = DSM 107014 TaxID=1521640 RepID=A0A941GTK6_9CHRO|nr:hypothetical protein [Gomphosphaeria aponina SAG 52.96 = DSM 107014]
MQPWGWDTVAAVSSIFGNSSIKCRFAKNLTNGHNKLVTIAEGRSAIGRSAIGRRKTLTIIKF